MLIVVCCLVSVNRKSDLGHVTKPVKRPRWQRRYRNKFRPKVPVTDSYCLATEACSSSTPRKSTWNRPGPRVHRGHARSPCPASDTSTERYQSSVHFASPSPSCSSRNPTMSPRISTRNSSRAKVCFLTNKKRNFTTVSFY